MTKICPKCKRPQDDERLVICPTCKVAFEMQAAEQQQAAPSVEAIASSLSAGQLARIAELIATSWKFRLVFVGVFAIGVLLSVPTVILLTLRHANSEIEKGVQTVREDATRHFSSATNETTRQFQEFVETATNQISRAYRSITNHISEEFQEPRIRKTVEDVAGKEAKAILEAEVRPTVDSFRADAEFLRLATRALAYDFKAYCKLLELKKNTNDLAHFAEQVIAETDRSLEKDRSEYVAHRAFWTFAGTNVYKGPFTSDELGSRFSYAKDDKFSNNREGFVNTVASLKEALFLPWLMEFLTNETDSAVADRLTIAISDLAREDFHPREFERIQTWWHSHQAEYTNWPVSTFWQGYGALAKADLPEAAKSFEQVLKLDTGADMSRALAIGSFVGMGNTNKAAELLKGFQSATGRWAQWAAAKVELQTGNVSNATVSFATLTRENPTMLVLPREGDFLWRKIDWELFRKSMEIKKP